MEHAGLVRRSLVIVGAGPAGMSAAIAAAEAGMRPTVVDENDAVGGQIYRQSHRAAGAPGEPALPKRGAELVRHFAALADQIEHLPRTRVWGVFGGRRLAVSGEPGWYMIDAERLIIAQGAYEFVPPFPGWTLPGVMTPGAAQSLAKLMHVRPGKRAVVAGTGPFLLVVAEQLAACGVEVAAIVEAAPRFAEFRKLFALSAVPPLAWEGLCRLARLRRAGIPFLRSHVVVGAMGNGALAEIAVAPCDRSWRPNRARAKVIPTDTLAVGFGFVPRTQLVQLAGCRMHYDALLGGWAPWIDDDMQTSLSGVWAAGDGAGVAGALAAREQGALAGLAAARQASAIDLETWHRKRRPFARRLRRLRIFRAALDRISQIRPGIVDLAAPDTIICRCEELTLGEIVAGIDAGGTSLRTLKVMTRLGMGPCQGQMCWPAMARLIAARTGRTIEEIGPLSVRPPASPISVGELAGPAASLGEPAAAGVNEGFHP